MSGIPKYTAEERFWTKVIKDGPVPAHAPHLGPCWTWTAAHTKAGYGQFYVGNSVWSSAHRYVYELVVGPIPAGLEIDHLCRNRGCPNPEHLEAVTRLTNTMRGGLANVTRQRHRQKTHCPHGHEYNARNTMMGSGNRRRCRECLRLDQCRMRSGDKSGRRGL